MLNVFCEMLHYFDLQGHRTQPHKHVKTDFYGFVQANTCFTYSNDHSLTKQSYEAGNQLDKSIQDFFQWIHELNREVFPQYDQSQTWTSLLAAEQHIL